MKVLRMILMGLFLTSVAFAGGINDHVRQLEPHGVFVDPLEEQKPLRVKKEEAKKQYDKYEKKQVSTKKTWQERADEIPLSYVLLEAIFGIALWIWLGRRIYVKLS